MCTLQANLHVAKGKEEKERKKKVTQKRFIHSTKLCQKRLRATAPMLSICHWINLVKWYPGAFGVTETIMYRRLTISISFGFLFILFFYTYCTICTFGCAEFSATICVIIAPRDTIFRGFKFFFFPFVTPFGFICVFFHSVSNFVFLCGNMLITFGLMLNGFHHFVRVSVSDVWWTSYEIRALIWHFLIKIII